MPPAGASAIIVREANVPIYMKYGSIDGDVTAKGHEKWIALESAQLSRSNRDGSMPDISEIVVTKFQDCASASLFRAVIEGKGEKAQIDFVRSNEGGAQEVYLSLKLGNTLISSYNSGGKTRDGSNAFETLALNFQTIEYGYHTASAPLSGSPPTHLYATP
jgi:type VI secretion system secreted protein Hcp